MSACERRVDLAVVGAGPAGLGAAAEAAAAGLEVAVLDEYPVAGGRLLGQLHRRGGTWHVGRERARLLVEEALGTGRVRLFLGEGVWALDRQGGEERPWRVFGTGESAALCARAVVVATGATEVSVPLPGWTLPGVLAVGAAQTLANGWGVAPGGRGVVVGLSPLAFAVAQELAWAGAPPVAIVAVLGGAGRAHLGEPEAQWEGLVRLRSAAPWWARPGVALLASRGARRRLVPHLPARGVPLFGSRLRLGWVAEAILGDPERGVRAVRLRPLDGEGRPAGAPVAVACDHVLLAGGLRPLPDLVAAAGGATARVAGLGGDVAVVGPDGECTVEGLLAAGNALGVEGAAVAEAQGRRAGLAAAARLGRSVPPARRAAARAAVERARAQAPFSFQPGVDEGHAEVLRRFSAWQVEHTAGEG